MNIQAPAILEAALKTWKKSKADFADCFILETVINASERPLGTFDTTLGKLEGCKQSVRGTVRWMVAVSCSLVCVVFGMAAWKKIEEAS